ncbi:MAG: OPT family oligopeptide transporter, partial [bacterium]
GWGFNMSITSALISYAFWQGSSKLFGTRSWGLLENNINQTTASSAAAISSAGLVAPIPALTMITGQTLSWPFLSLWVFSVATVGVTVAIGLRRQMLVVDKLPFPSGIATAETVKEMYAKGAEAIARVKVLISMGVIAASLKILTMLFSIPRIGLPGSVSTRPGGLLMEKGINSISMKNLTFALDPSLMMIGVGALVGFKGALSMLVGAILSWYVIAPRVMELGWAAHGAIDPSVSWYKNTLHWLLWPGVAMMVTASLTSLAFSWRSMLSAITGKNFNKNKKSEGSSDSDNTEIKEDEVPRKVFKIALVLVLTLSVTLQVILFDISAITAVFGVFLTFFLAVVAARVSGETAVTPVGAMGKVTQLIFGVVDPGQPVSNLMAANVTGGAASQCADLLHDMKAGKLLGASPRLQCYAQFFGTIAGALAGSAAYLVLIPDPQNQLLTDEWPAPAVATWKAVAEVFMTGFDAMPEGSVTAMIIAGVVGILMAILAKTAPGKYSFLILSPSAMGLGFVIPAYNSIGMFIGGVTGLLLTRYCKTWSSRFLTVAAAGLIAGESLTGILGAIASMLFQ